MKYLVQTPEEKWDSSRKSRFTWIRISRQRGKRIGAGRLGLFYFLDDVKRPLFNLFVNSAEIFAKHADNQKLDRAENRDAGHEGSPAGNQFHAEDEMLDKH